MKTVFALVSLASGALPAAAQHASASHHWTLLLQEAADRIEIDTSTVRARDGSWRVWLRWSAAPGAGDIAAVYSIEEREIDCSGRRTRVLLSQAVGGSEADTAHPTLVGEQGNLDQ